MGHIVTMEEKKQVVRECLREGSYPYLEGYVDGLPPENVGALYELIMCQPECKVNGCIVSWQVSRGVKRVCL